MTVTDVDFYSKSLSDITDVEFNFHSSISNVYWTCRKTGIRYFSLDKSYDFGLSCLPKFYSIAKINISRREYDPILRDTKFVTHSFYLVPAEAENKPVPYVMNIL